MLADLAAVRLTEVLHVARRRGASDIHLAAGMPPIFRIDGDLHAMEASALDHNHVDAIARRILHDSEFREFTDNGDATGTYTDPGSGRTRVHAYRTGAGVTIAIRLLALSVPTLESLHVPSAVAGFCNLTRGLVIIAGPTGSGKSTLAAAMLDRINRSSARHIVTIEDPVEYEHRSLRSLISQRRIGVDAASYERAIYGTLRSDPDVILIGEMRDAATMHAALTAAETGHLIFATLHTGEAGETIDRIVGTFPSQMQPQIRIQLAQTLAGVVCMRLIRKAAGAGRVCAFEILVAADAVRQLIRDGKTHQIKNVISTSRSSGMQTLESHLAELAARGEIAPEPATAVWL